MKNKTTVTPQKTLQIGAITIPLSKNRINLWKVLNFNVIKSSTYVDNTLQV